MAVCSGHSWRKSLESNLTVSPPVWDTSMITKFVGPDDKDSLNSWTNVIVNEINNGIYKHAVSEWLACSDINDAEVCAAPLIAPGSCQVLIR